MRNRARFPVALYMIAASCGTATTRGGPGGTRPDYARCLQLEATAATSANISFGDLDGDGNLDIVLAKGRHWPLPNRVLFGDGRGGIRQARDLGATADRTYTGALADFDGDGDLDVLISNEADPQLVYLNDGAGNFHVGSSFGEGWPTRNSTVADLDGDGALDVVVANRGGKTSGFICKNDGRGGFTGDGAVAVVDYSTTTITCADFDGDGRLDLLAPCRDGGQSYVHLAAPDLHFPEQRRVPFGPPDASIRIACAADFDGDGALDIAAIDDRRGTAQVYFGEPGGGFTDAIEIQRNEGPPPARRERRDDWVVPYALAVFDLDGDGAMDIVVGNRQRRPNVYFHDGGRRFTAVPFGDDEGAAYGFDVADFDGDGVEDIGMARSGAPNMVYFGQRR